MNVRLNKARVFSAGARSTLTGAALLLTQLAISAHAGPNEQAKRIYERIAGEPPAPAVLSQMATAITTSPGQAGRRHHRHQRPVVLQRDAEEPGDPVDQSRPERVRALQ
jgi:hypothetical protein